MKKGLLIVLILMCTAALMAAMAYSSATITNASMLTVSNTNDALLALIPKGSDQIGNKDKTASVESGKLVFHFSKNNGVDYGLQPGSTYQWDNLFSAKNNSSETISFKMSQSAAIPNATISVRVNGFSTWIPLTTTAIKIGPDISAGGTSGIDVKIDVGNTTLGSYTPNIIVEAAAK